MQWHTVAVWPSHLFQEDHKKGGDDVVSVHTPSETDQDFLARQLMQKATKLVFMGPHSRLLTEWETMGLGLLLATPPACMS